MNEVVLEKKSNEFTILNLTDIQLSNEDWEDGTANKKILEHTVRELIKRTAPDLITITGDLSWAGRDYAYDMLANFLDSFQIPWAPIWGNHDNQRSEEYIKGVAERYKLHPFCIYQDGPKEFGNGNYIIKVNLNDNIACTLIMLDTHNKEKFINENGETVDVWGKLRPCQIEWVESLCEELKKDGCNNAVIFEHIPINGYRAASKAAYKPEIDLKGMSVKDSLENDCWNIGYEDSIGVQHEGISSYPTDEGVFDMLKRVGIVSHVISGHDHINNFIIGYEGIKFVYALKTGAGCYWEPMLNGGTVIKISKNGVSDVYHEYVDPNEAI